MKDGVLLGRWKEIDLISFGENNYTRVFFIPYSLKHGMCDFPTKFVVIYLEIVMSMGKIRFKVEFGWIHDGN